ncbi:LysR family transcriptional regulator [Acidisoma cellulosilytica]|uniref:LysR family transcriptional regulator n=1 Tax=Acidisoma cellulosilyticum TaxID=2802395 RepID=A0A963YXJ2_9PROT|nr:LysR substrate-binding domain-containing protein [Acidisoma cellulosilyticum]MCB8878755.1 LysR family transcriptional regulator [Acidisoma cellulosilyticum]
MRKLPPLSALRVFEVAARTSSYVEAGAELGLTHGAVSRQITALETWLGQRLFVRIGRRMVATQAARAFAMEISRSFDRIMVAADACGRPSARRVLRVSAPTTFAMRRLIPRLEHFQATWPDVEINVTTVTIVQEELRRGFDVAIRRGSEAEAWPQHHAVEVLEEYDTVIASPAFLAEHGIRSPQDILDKPLIATETRPRDWADWLNAAGLPHPTGRRQVFDHFFISLQAIGDGFGLGIGAFPLIEREVALGRLSTPFPDIRVPRRGYVALIPFDADKSPALTGFVEWLVAEGKT